MPRTVTVDKRFPEHKPSVPGFSDILSWYRPLVNGHSMLASKFSGSEKRKAQVHTFVSTHSR